MNRAQKQGPKVSKIITHKYTRQQKKGHKDSQPLGENDYKMHKMMTNLQRMNAWRHCHKGTQWTNKNNKEIQNDH